MYYKQDYRIYYTNKLEYILNKEVFCFLAVSDNIPNIFKNGGHQRRKRSLWSERAEREKAASHLGDIRSLGREQSRPTGEQSRSLELRYHRLVGPSVWKCTCRRAGLQLRRDIGGAGWAYWAVCLSAVTLSEICIPLILSTPTHLLLLYVFDYLEHTAHLFYHLLPRLPLLLPICCFLFPFLF